MENLEDLKEEIKYLNNENDTQFDIIDGLYTTIISAVLKNEISAGQFNILCKAYEILGGDTWEPEMILKKVTDIENIKPEYLEILKKGVSKNENRSNSQMYKRV